MTALAIAVKYWREIAIGFAVIVILCLAGYVKHVFSDRARLAQENIVLKKDLESSAKMMELTNKITEAISQIKIRSSANVQHIEREPKPVFVDNSRPVLLIPAGLLQGVYSSGAAGRTAAGHAGGGDLAGNKSGG